MLRKTASLFTLLAVLFAWVAMPISFNPTNFSAGANSAWAADEKPTEVVKDKKAKKDKKDKQAKKPKKEKKEKKASKEKKAKKVKKEKKSTKDQDG